MSNLLSRACGRFISCCWLLCVSISIRNILLFFLLHFYPFIYFSSLVEIVYLYYFYFLPCYVKSCLMNAQFCAFFLFPSPDFPEKEEAKLIPTLGTDCLDSLRHSLDSLEKLSCHFAGFWTYEVQPGPNQGFSNKLTESSPWWDFIRRTLGKVMVKSKDARTRLQKKIKFWPRTRSARTTTLASFAAILVALKMYSMLPGGCQIRLANPLLEQKIQRRRFGWSEGGGA